MHKIEDGAIVYKNDSGKLHRLDGPAYIGVDGYKKAWYINGLRHREDGPAYTANNLKTWWIEGKRHREDGPAVIYNGKEEWFIDGNKLLKQEIEYWMKEYNIPKDYALWNDCHKALFLLRF